MKHLAFVSAVAMALSPTIGAQQPPTKNPPKSAAPPKAYPKITEADRKTLMDVVDVIEVASLMSIGDWQVTYSKKTSRPLSNTAAAKSVIEQSDPKTRGAGGICKGDIAEYELVQKHRESIQKVFEAAATFGGESKDKVGYGDQAFRFASQDGQTVGILAASSAMRFDISKQDDVSRASKAAAELALPLANALAEFSKPDAPPLLGVVVTYGLHSGNPKETMELGESMALVWDAKSIAEFKAGKMSRKLFLSRATAYMTDRDSFSMKKFDVKL